MLGMSFGGEPPPKKKRARKKRRARTPRVPRVRGLATVKDADLAAELKLVKGEEVIVTDIPNKPGFCVIFTSDGGVKFPVSHKDVALVKIDKEAEYEAFREARARAAMSPAEAEEEEWEDFAAEEAELLADEELLDYALESELLSDDDEEPEDEEPEAKAAAEKPKAEAEPEDEGLLVDDDEDLYAELLADSEEEDPAGEADPFEDDDDFDEEGNLRSEEDKKALRHSRVAKKVLERGDGPKGKPLFAKKREKGSWSRLEVLHGRTKPYDAKEDLKGLKFRWDNTGKVWWKRVRDGQIDSVVACVEELGCKIRVVSL